MQVKTLYLSPLCAIIEADVAGKSRPDNDKEEHPMTLKRLLCALLCALMIASVPALAEEPAAETDRRSAAL